MFIFPNSVYAAQVENSVTCNEGVIAEPIDMVYGEHTVGCEVVPAADIDQFKYIGSSGGVIRFNILGQSNNFDARLEVRDPNGVVVLDNFCSANAINQCSFSNDLSPTETGTYTLAISDAGIDNPGNYQISLQCLFGMCPNTPVV